MPGTQRPSRGRAPWTEAVVSADTATAACAGAAQIAAAAREAIRLRGRCVLGLSGGRAVEPMLRALASAALDWRSIEVVQVDERIAPADSEDRNLTPLRRCLLVPAALPPSNLHPMPVEDADPERAAARYAEMLVRLAGSPPEIDLVHLGLGTDGHTASLAPGDPVLDVTDADVAVTGIYRGRRRMTLTLPALNRARRVVWLVTGADKAAVLARLEAGDTTLPAGRIAVARAHLHVDRDAAALIIA